MEINNSETFGEWDQWKGTLAKTVSIAEIVGLSQKTIEKIAVKIGNILSSSVDPENREQRLLQELWIVADDDDRMVLSKLIVKMLQTDMPH